MPEAASSRLPMGLPLDTHQLARLAEIEQLVGARYQGWGQTGAGRTFFVDVIDPVVDRCVRFEGETLHLAIGRALEAARRARS
jgi:hypothetical protein